MQNENFVEKIASNLGQSASIKNVFGEPVHTGEKTIIPVARIAYGFGGGFGQGLPQTDKGNGGGAGGGLQASARGVYEITPGRTRFIPASPFKHVLLGFAIGLMVKVLFAVKR